MPFDPSLDRVFEGLIRPALEDAGFAVTRADLSNNQQQILKDIVNELARADLVVVDVTGLNGNVMYELGLAHAMGRRTVMITQDISELPFDLRSYRATGYSTDFVEAPKLRERLKAIADAVVDGSAEFSNPVQDFAPDFLGRPEQVASAPTRTSKTNEAHVDQAGDDGGAQEEGEYGLLDYSIQLADSNERAVEIAQAISTATGLIGEKAQVRSAEISRVNKLLGAKAGPTLRNIMRDSAVDFNDFAEELEVQNPLLLQELTSIANSANGLARLRTTHAPQEREQILSDIRSMQDAESSFAEAHGSVSTFAKSLKDLPSMERSLNLAVRRAAAAVDATADAIELGRSEFARVRGLLQERLSDND